MSVVITKLFLLLLLLLLPTPSSSASSPSSPSTPVAAPTFSALPLLLSKRRSARSASEPALSPALSPALAPASAPAPAPPALSVSLSVSSVLSARRLRRCSPGECASRKRNGVSPRERRWVHTEFRVATMSDEVPCTAASVLPVVWLCGCAFPHVSGLPPTGSTYEGRPANFRRAYDNIMSSPVSNVGGASLKRSATSEVRRNH
mmetsp:Transcript_30450/g.55369  ORF Transcript_30450/g.55369 Transcript_30450/m.55369 type:complete len:204 (+) Transcript_30450:219-830(+)